MTTQGTWLVDTHCHLMLPDFEEDREAVLARARQAGVRRIVMPGVDLETSRQALELAKKTPGLYAAVGVHPHQASTWGDGVRKALANLARAPQVVAIGETGLDYYRRLSSPEDQRKALLDQLALARDLSLPVILHNREATEDLLAILERWLEDLPPGLAGRAGVLHAFSATPQAASRAAQGGFYLGVAGPVTYPKAETLRRTVAVMPGDRLLLETDSPYLAPHPYRGRRNEPAHLRLVAEQVAEARNEALDCLTEATWHNAANLFGWSHGTENGDLL